MPNPMNPSVADIVAAFETAERTRLAAIKAAETAARQKQEAITADCKRTLDEILAEFAPTFVRAAELNRGMVKHAFDDTRRSWMSRYDHKFLLTVLIDKDVDGYEFSAWNGRTENQYNYTAIPPSLITRDPTEFKVWLARFLGEFIARQSHA